MIKILVLMDSRGGIRHTELSGHAGAGEYGEDIVCAAVSSQMISVENSLEKVLHAPYTVEVNEVEGGYMKLSTPRCAAKQMEHDTQILLRHLVLALEILAENYPQFITFEIQYI